MAAVLVAASAGGVVARQVIRSSTDLISIDVQVVDREGNPITGLTRDQFSVEIEGKPRPVSVLDFVRADTRRIKVRVNQKGASVRSREVVVVSPKP